MDMSLLAEVLESHAPLQPAPLCPELRVYHARSLVDVWTAAERAAGCVLPAPFWAYPWAAGAAIARVILDRPELVRARSVLDFGAGGGVSSLAAAYAGACRVVANDIDPLALGTVALAAAAQGLSVETLLADLTAETSRAEGFDVVLAGDLAYEQQVASSQLALLRQAANRGAWVLAGNAGRAWFDPAGMELIAEYAVPVPVDLEGVGERTARVYRVLPAFA